MAEKKTLPMKEIIRIVMEMLSEHSDEKLPVRVRFDIQGTDNQAFLSIEQDELDRSKRRITVAANRKGTDLLVNHFYPAGTLAEIKAYLDRQDTSEIEKSVYELSDSVDDKW